MNVHSSRDNFQGARKRPEIKNGLLPVSSLEVSVSGYANEVLFFAMAVTLKNIQTPGSVFLILNYSIRHWSLEASECFCENEI
jgi:hypothetical protein